MSEEPCAIDPEVRDWVTSRWRKGPEELPDEGIEVLTWRAGEYKLAELSRSRGGYWGDWLETARGGTSDGFNWGDEWHAREPTYWMPLPEPPPK